MSSVLTTRSRVLVADYPPGAIYGPRVLEDHELVWLLAGAARWLVRRPSGAGSAEGADRDETYDLLPGTVAIARAGWRDEFQWDPARPSRHAYVHFATSGSGLLPPISQWPVTVPIVTPLLRALTDALTETSDVDTAGARRRSDLAVELLVETLLAGRSEPVTMPTDPVEAAVLEFVATTWGSHGLRAIQAAELAAGTHVSPRQLFRTFATRYGIGPVRALELVRLSRAAILLHRSNEPIARIASVTGFANPYHFSRRFSAAYGQPPRQFRSDPAADPLAPVHAAGLGRMTHRMLPVVPAQPPR